MSSKSAAGNATLSFSLGAVSYFAHGTVARHNTLLRVSVFSLNSPTCMGVSSACAPSRTGSQVQPLCSYYVRRLIRVGHDFGDPARRRQWGGFGGARSEGPSSETLQSNGSGDVMRRGGGV